MVSTTEPRRTRRPRSADASIWKGWTRSSETMGNAVLISRHPPRRRAPRRRSAEAPGEDALLRVQAIFRLVPDHRLRSVDDRGADFLAALDGQTVHEDGAGLGAGH